MHFIPEDLCRTCRFRFL